MEFTAKQITQITISALNKVPEPVVWLDKRGRIIYANEQASKHFGYTQDELLQLGVWDVDPQYSFETYSKMWQEHLGTFHTVETVHVRKDGARIPVYVIGTYEKYDDIEVRVSFIFDISSLKATKTLNLHEETLLQYEKIMSISHDCLAYIDKNQRYRATNRAYLEAFNLSNTPIIGKHLKDILPKKHYENVVKKNINKALNGQEVTFEEWYDLPKFGKRYMQVRYQPYQTFGSNETDGVAISLFDVTDWYKAKEKLRKIAEYDDLTKLPNRHKFSLELDEQIKKNKGTQNRLAVLFIDLDRSKLINDSLGHPVGDMILQHIAKRIKNFITEGDILARAGGDEFLLLMNNIEDNNKIAIICKRLFKELERPIIIDKKELFVSGSIGVSIHPFDALDAEGMIQSADTAMVQAKKLGRSNYQFSTNQIREAMFERFFLENSLRMALENKEFLLYFQPQFNIEDKTVSGAEVLIRWNQPSMGIISPAKFIPIAEESGLITQIGEWVLEQSCIIMKRWQEEKKPIKTISVNVSGHQLLQSDFALKVKSILSKHKLNPSCIELEITESYLMHDIKSVTKTLTSLRDIGVKIAIDDFGTSYASLKYLQSLPINKLKIDRSFLRDVPTNKDDCTLVKTIINLAKNMEMNVIAEGVEKIEQEEFLKKHYCFNAQGFLYTMPIEQSEFEKRYLKN
jgi:diguanylate cyclase (GGDEF)-like protein/PAS domain S-box-containing protein